MWAHFLGYGFTKPIDDMGPHNPPSHPELLDSLAKRFRAQQLRPEGADALDRAQRAVRPVEPDQPAQQGRRSARWARSRMFSHFYLRQMRPKSCTNRCSSPPRPTRPAARRRAAEDQKRDWLKQFTIAFGTDDNDEATTFNGTIPQALMMINGDLMQQATSDRPRAASCSAIAATPSWTTRQKINHLYLAALARRPTTAGARRSPTSCCGCARRNVGGGAARYVVGAC